MIQEGYMMQSTDAGIGTHTQFRTKLEQEIGGADGGFIRLARQSYD